MHRCTCIYTMHINIIHSHIYVCILTYIYEYCMRYFKSLFILSFLLLFFSLHSSCSTAATSRFCTKLFLILCYSWICSTHFPQAHGLTCCRWSTGRVLMLILLSSSCFFAGLMRSSCSSLFISISRAAMHTIELLANNNNIYSTAVQQTAKNLRLPIVILLLP